MKLAIRIRARSGFWSETVLPCWRRPTRNPSGAGASALPLPAGPYAVLPYLAWRGLADYCLPICYSKPEALAHGCGVWSICATLWRGKSYLRPQQRPGIC